MGIPTKRPDTICTGFQYVSKRKRQKAPLSKQMGQNWHGCPPVKLPNTEKSEKILEIQRIPCYNGICIWIT